MQARSTSGSIWRKTYLFACIYLVDGSRQISEPDNAWASWEAAVSTSRKRAEYNVAICDTPKHAIVSFVVRQMLPSSCNTVCNGKGQIYQEAGQSRRIEAMATPRDNRNGKHPTDVSLMLYRIRSWLFGTGCSCTGGYR